MTDEKKIQELELEIKKSSPSHNVINTRILTKAASIVNEKIRNQGLSAKEIIFSRDQLSNDNLYLRDQEIKTEIMKNRHINNVYSAKSKASIPYVAQSAEAQKGNIVFLKHDGEKLKRRDKYLVLEQNVSNGTLIICKISDTETKTCINSHLSRYKVKQTEVYLAPEPA